MLVERLSFFHPFGHSKSDGPFDVSCLAMDETHLSAALLSGHHLKVYVESL